MRYLCFAILLAVMLVMGICGGILGDPPPGWPPPSYVMERQWQNIKDYGAKGDGTTDDRAAIQAALDAVGDSGGTVFVPHSDSGFLIKSKLVIKQYTTLLGGGRGSKIRADASLPPFTMIENTNAAGGTPYDSNIVIDGIFFDGGQSYIRYDSTDSASMVELRYARRCVVRNSFFARSDKDAIGIRNSRNMKVLNNIFWELGEEGVVISRVSGKGNIVSGNHFIMRDSSYVGLTGEWIAGIIPAAMLVNATNAIVSQNVFWYGGGGIDMFQQTDTLLEIDTTYSIIITENQFIETQNNNCISPQRGYNVTICNNSFFDCNALGIYITEGTGGWTYGQAEPDTTPHDYIISGNQFLDHRKVAIWAEAGHGHQITNNIFSNLDTTAIISGGDRSVITGNRITGVTAGHGIWIKAQQNSIISDNQVSYVNKSGIYFDLFATLHEYLSVTANSVKDCGEFGLNLKNVGFSVVSNNVCLDNDSAGIYVNLSSHNLIADNVSTSSDSTQGYGILLESSSNYNILRGNIVGGNATGAISGADGNLEYGNRTDTLSAIRLSFQGDVGIGTQSPQVSLHIDTIAPRIFLNATDTGGIAAGDAQIRFDSAGSLGFSIVFDADTTSDFYIRNHMTTNNSFRIARNGAITFNEVYGFPTSDGTAGYVLETNGAGELSWQPNDTGAGAGGEANTISDTGTYNDTEGFGLAGGKTGVSLKVKGLIEGSNITITKSGDSALTFTATGGSGFWAFRDSTTIVYVNDSTGDTIAFIQDTAGFQGLRVSGIITDTLTVNNYMKVPSIYGDEVGSYKIRIFDTVVFSSSNVRPSYSPNQTYYPDSNFITINHVQKIAGDSSGAGSVDTAIVLTEGGSKLKILKWGTDTLWLEDTTTATQMLYIQSNEGLAIRLDSLFMANSDINKLDGARLTVSSGILSVDLTGALINLASEVTGVLPDANVADALTVTGYMQDEDINTFAELQSWVSGKTLLNEEDAATIDVGWTFVGLLAADSTNTDHLVSGSVYLGNDTLKGVDVLVVDSVVVDGDVIKDFTGTNLSVTDGVLNASGGGLSYFTEADDNDTSVFTATGPNTTVGFNDNVTMQGNDITGVGNLTVATGITVPDNSINDEELDEGANFTWTGNHTYYLGLLLDDGAGASPSFTLRDQGDKNLVFAKYDEGYSVVYNDEGANRFYASGDVDDYIYFDTFAADVPMISTGGNCDLVVNASSGEISFGDENLTTTGTLDVGNIALSNDSIYGVDVITPDTVVVDGDVIKDFTGTNLSVTAGVLNAVPGSGFWTFRDSSTIVHVNDSTGDTVLFIQDTIGSKGVRVIGNVHLFANNTALILEDDSENDAKVSVGNSQLCIAIDPGGLVASSDICFDIDGDEVARFHQNTNFGIGTGTAIPPERITVVGNIATGDTTTGDVDVFHFFSTDGSWNSEWLVWNDGGARFELSDDFYVAGDISLNGSITGYFDTAAVVDTAQALDNIVLSKVRDTVMAVLDTIWFGMTIDNPDGLTKDSVMVLAVNAEWAPSGITLLSVGIKTWAATTYSVDFIEFTEPGDGGSESAIETVATSTSREAEDDGTLTDADIAAGSIIVVDLPATDIAELMVWGTYTVD